MHLSDLKKRIVDLRYSEVDDEKSGEKIGTYGRKGGKYFFVKKVYVDYLTGERRPEFRFDFIHAVPENQYAEVQDYKYGEPPYTFVDTDDPFWPEGIPPDQEGHYRFKDTLMMKTSLAKWVEKEKENVKMSELLAQKKSGKLRGSKWGKMGRGQTAQSDEEILLSLIK